MEDTESSIGLQCLQSPARCYSGLDPMEDTERSATWCPSAASTAVTVGSIRWRILKAGSPPACCHSRRVTVGSIRWRILKELYTNLAAPAHLSYSGLDPMEDTEREIIGSGQEFSDTSYSGLDPMEEGWRSPDCLR